jgi:Lon protease-like protein
MPLWLVSDKIRFVMRTLPLFPLHTVLFPGMPIQLHVFEDRYRLMIRNCIEGGSPFGVVLIRKGHEARGPLPVPHAVGCTAHITTVEPMQGGHFNLTAQGNERFRILSLQTDKSYLVGQVELLPSEQSQSIEIKRGVRRLLAQLQDYLDLLKGSGSEDIQLVGLPLPEDPLVQVYLAAALLQIPPEEKQPLLAADFAGDLLEEITRLYRREIALWYHLNPVGGDVPLIRGYLN